MQPGNYVPWQCRFLLMSQEMACYMHMDKPMRRQLHPMLEGRRARNRGRPWYLNMLDLFWAGCSVRTLVYSKRLTDRFCDSCSRAQPVEHRRRPGAGRGCFRGSCGGGGSCRPGSCLAGGSCSCIYLYRTQGDATAASLCLDTLAVTAA